LSNGTDKEITERLVAVRGIGEWSAQMYLLFTLQRPDIFAVGDLGIQRGMAAWIGRDIAKLRNKGKGKWKYLSEKEMLEISEPWKPWRSLASWYMWRVDGTVLAVGAEDTIPDSKHGI